MKDRITAVKDRVKDSVTVENVKQVAAKGRKVSSQAISIAFLAYGVTSATETLVNAPSDFRRIVR